MKDSRNKAVGRMANSRKEMGAVRELFQALKNRNVHLKEKCDTSNAKMRRIKLVSGNFSTLETQ